MKKEYTVIEVIQGTAERDFDREIMGRVWR